MGLAIRPNSRQIPKHREYTASKLYNDSMYAYIQSISIADRDWYRHVNSSDISFVKLGKALDISPPTAKKRLEGLQELQLIGEKKRGKYDVFPIAEEYAALVPMDVIEGILTMQVPHMMNIYVDMMNRYFANNQQGFRFTISSVKENIGISTNTYNNSDVITNALEALDSLSLIDFFQGNIQEHGSWKMIQRCNEVSNKIIKKM